MRGRKPHPTAIKLIRGNPGRRPLNPYEPAHEPLDPTVPVEFANDPIASAEWTRIVAAVGNGHCTTVDRVTLMAYTLKYSQWLRLEAEAEKHPLIIRGPSGAPVGSPFLKLANKVLLLLLKAAVELGITPSSRSRIIAMPTTAPEPSGDPFTAFQQQRDRL